MSSADKFKYIFQEVVPLPRQNNQILGDASSQPRWPRSPEPFRDAVVSTKKKMATAKEPLVFISCFKIIGAKPEILFGVGL